MTRKFMGKHAKYKNWNFVAFLYCLAVLTGFYHTRCTIDIKNVCWNYCKTFRNVYENKLFLLFCYGMIYEFYAVC